jgi:hypothetical protein
LSCPDPTSWAADCEVADDVTVTFRGLLLPPASRDSAPFGLLEFNPWQRATRADSETARAWADGAWSGAEWYDATTIPLTVLVRAPDVDQRRGTRFWLAHQQQLAAAFAASHTDLPLEFTVANPDTGGDTYVVWGRPRLLDPLPSTAPRGWALCRVGFRIVDPLIYSGGPTGVRTATMGLPLAVGGLCVSPLCAPFGVTATVVAGSAVLVACGTSATGLQLVVYGPCTDPRVTLLTEGAGAQVLRYHGALAAGQFLVLDTKARTALLNGTVSRRGLVSGDWFLLPPGGGEVAFAAADYSPDARLEVAWRDAWLT